MNRPSEPDPRVSAAEQAALLRALALAASPDVPLHPNPRVGCVLLAPDGEVVGEGFHHGAGTPHAEVEALAVAGERARGATAVVTLEPCNHTGRTGPCAQALIAAGVRRVVAAQRDPNPLAEGGAATLRAAGIEVVVDAASAEAEALNPAWTFAHRHARPFVTFKYAATLDGRSAAADGTSQWITSATARRDVHRLRGLVDTMLVGTGTALADDPLLTARADDGSPLAVQPLRAVMGERALPPTLRLFSGDDGAAPGLHLRTRDPGAALRTLYADHDRHHVLLEGGPSLGAAFLAAGLVDEIVAYLAPALLGAGAGAVGDLGITTVADTLRLHLHEAVVLGADEEATVRLTLHRPITKGTA